MLSDGFLFFISQLISSLPYLHTHTHTHTHTHIFAQQLHGNVGVLFTNKPKEEVWEWFKTFADQDFARSGFIAERDITLDAGPLEKFPHNMEPQLRKLGLPTALKKGTHSLVPRFPDLFNIHEFSPGRY